jgi:cytochrome c
MTRADASCLSLARRVKAFVAGAPGRVGVAGAVLAAILVPTPTPAADLARGEQLFHTCAACHSVLGDGIGPDITGIYGQPAGMRPGFSYSDALKHRGLTWNEANLRAFIHNPQAFVPGTLMSFPGYERAADIDDVVAYLRTLK